MKEVKERLDRTAHQTDFDAGETPSLRAWVKASTMPLDRLRTGTIERDRSVEEDRSPQDASEVLFRTSNESLMAVGFDPWRHTAMVTGRPVQVSFDSWKPHWKQIYLSCHAMSHSHDFCCQACQDRHHRAREPIAPPKHLALPPVTTVSGVHF